MGQHKDIENWRGAGAGKDTEKATGVLRVRRAGLWNSTRAEVGFEAEEAEA